MKLIVCKRVTFAHLFNFYNDIWKFDFWWRLVQDNLFVSIIQNIFRQFFETKQTSWKRKISSVQNYFFFAQTPRSRVCSKVAEFLGAWDTAESKLCGRYLLRHVVQTLCFLRHRTEVQQRRGSGAVYCHCGSSSGAGSGSYTYCYI